MSTSDTELITTAEAARLLEVNSRTVTRYVLRDRLTPVAKLSGIRGAYLFNRDDVVALKHSTELPPVERETHPSSPTGQRDTQHAVTSPQSAAENPNSAAAGPVAPMDTAAYQRLLDAQDARAAGKLARKSA